MKKLMLVFFALVCNFSFAQTLILNPNQPTTLELEQSNNPLNTKKLEYYTIEVDTNTAKYFRNELRLKDEEKRTQQEQLNYDNLVAFLKLSKLNGTNGKISIIVDFASLRKLYSSYGMEMSMPLDSAITQKRKELMILLGRSLVTTPIINQIKQIEKDEGISKQNSVFSTTFYE